MLGDEYEILAREVGIKGDQFHQLIRLFTIGEPNNPKQGGVHILRVCKAFKEGRLAQSKGND